jgi:hypothetical protein
MGLLTDAGGDDEPVRDASGTDQPLWMGSCASCGSFMTVLGGTDDEDHYCDRCPEPGDRA